MTAPRRILLTGATGFVGRQICRALTARGEAVTTVVRAGGDERSHGRAEVLVVSDVFAQPRDWWAQTCAGFDVVVHAAWHVTPPHYLSAPENLACLHGSLALALGARDAGVRHFVGIGTCFEYAFGPDALGPDARLDPTTLYAAAKTSLFLTARSLFAGSDTGFAWARLFYLYGDGEAPGRLVPHLRARLAAGEAADLSAGTQVRDFLDVAVAGEMIADIVTTGQLGAINVCSGRPMTIRFLAEQIADEYGRRDLLRFGTAPMRPTDPPVVLGICNVERRKTS